MNAYNLVNSFVPFILLRNLYSYFGMQADGCVLVKTTQAVLVAEYVAPTQAGEATTIVEGLADYLKSVNY